MSQIQMINPTIQVNGTPFEGKLKALGQGVDMAQAHALVNTRPDGYDTIGVQLEGKDYLLLTKNAEMVRATDQLFINGKRAQIIFEEFENQEPVSPLMRIGGSALGGTVGAAFGAVGGFMVSMLADNILPVYGGAVVGAGLGMVAGFMGPGMDRYEIDESITDSLTDKFVTART